MNTTMTTGQLALLLKLLNEKHMTPERMQLILTSGILADVFDADANLNYRDAVRAALKLDVVMPEQFVLSVDYSRSLGQMIAEGKYNCIKSSIIAEKFSLVGSGVKQFEAKLFNFNRPMCSEAVIEAIKADSWELGKIEHLLAFGEKYPEEQRRYPITALGSVMRVSGCRYVPFLYVYNYERDLHLYNWGDDGLDDRYRVLAVRPIKTSESSAAVA